MKKLFQPDTIESVWNNDIFSYIGNLLSDVSGLRQGEVLALETKNIFSEYIHIKHSFSAVDGLKSTKTGDKGDIPISPFVYSFHENLIKPEPDAYLFSIKGDRPLL